MPEILQIHLENLFNDPNTHKWDGWRQPDIKNQSLAEEAPAC